MPYYTDMVRLHPLNYTDMVGLHPLNYTDMVRLHPLNTDMVRLHPLTSFRPMCLTQALVHMRWRCYQKWNIFTEGPTGKGQENGK